MTFWIIVFACTALAAAFLAWIFLRPLEQQAQHHKQRIARNVELYRQRLGRLEDEKSRQYIDEQEFEELKIELARQLLKDIEQLQEAPATVSSHRKWLLLLVPFPLLALFLYSAIGAWPDWQITRQLDALQQSQSIQEYQSRLDRLQQDIARRLEQRPDHIDYRMLMASHAMGEENYSDAAMHYGILAELMPENDEILALYAQAEYLRDDRTLNATVALYMERALRINPYNTTVLGLQGIHAIQQGDYQTVLDAWQRLLIALPEDSQERELIEQGVAVAREQLGDKAQLLAIDTLTVQLSADDSLMQLEEDLPIFVYVRAADGPTVPLAASRLRMGDLPLSITLDDSMAMTEGLKLSDYRHVIVGARIAVSGDARGQPGDWQGEVEVYDWHERPLVNLVIDSQVSQRAEESRAAPAY